MCDAGKVVNFAATRTRRKRRKGLSCPLAQDGSSKSHCCGCPEMLPLASCNLPSLGSAMLRPQSEKQDSVDQSQLEEYSPDSAAFQSRSKTWPIRFYRQVVRCRHSGRLARSAVVRKGLLERLRSPQNRDSCRTWSTIRFRLQPIHSQALLIDGADRSCETPFRLVTFRARRRKHRCAKLVSSGRWQQETFNAFGLRK